MEDQELVTVYRSADEDAEDDAATARDLLVEAGLNPAVFDDDAMGVVEGAFEVRVPADQVAHAEEVLAANTRVLEQHVDPSDSFDLVTVFHSVNTTAEIEALGIKAILNASGIDAVIVGNPSLPNLGFQVCVPRQSEAQAHATIAEAQAAGPAAADEAEQASESQ